jgi:hypothetical protein
VDWLRGGASVCRWEYLDEQVHASRSDYAALAAAFRDRSRSLFLPAFRALAPGALVLLFGDHGFVENPAYPAFPSGDRPPTPRYVHGGLSPEEVLAPWALLRRVPCPPA